MGGLREAGGMTRGETLSARFLVQVFEVSFLESEMAQVERKKNFGLDI